MKWLSARLRSLLSVIGDFVWPLYLRTVQCHRAGAQASGITITVILGVYSLAISIATLREWLIQLGWPTLIPLIFLTSYALIVVSGGIALRTADPDTYARSLLAGRPPKEVLFTISKRIEKSCRRTLRFATWEEKVLWQLEELTRSKGGKPLERKLPAEIGLPLERRWSRWTTPLIRGVSRLFFWIWNLFRPERTRPTGLPPSLCNEIDYLVWWLRRLPRKQHTELVRIEVMKYLASKELDIPPRRLCDHLFQYSPAMHRDRLTKHAQNWEEILDFQSLNKGLDKQRLRGKVVQNLAYIENTRLRRLYQKQILENRDLHRFIVQFASIHSSSGSLQTYADALRFVAIVGERSFTEHGGKAPKRAAKKIQTRFVFLRRKQRAHPGFDLHALLLRAIQCMPLSALSQLSNARELLEDLKETPSTREGAAPEITLDRLESFRYLSFHLASLVASSRERISESFRGVYGEWFSKVQARHIVTHGYSRTVLTVLKRSLPAADPEKISREFPRLFFLLPDPNDSFDTRVMEYELKEEPGLRRRFKSVAAGSESHLLGLLQNISPVLILLGAECFDGARRMVHPKGLGPVLRAFLEKLEALEIPSLVVVVAESYKLHQSSLPEDPGFYGQHFDRIDLFPPDLIHLIITDQQMYSEKNVVRKRRLRVLGGLEPTESYESEYIGYS